jgi:16S rRNA (guanine966-N2)-methyltransferase
VSRIIAGSHRGRRLAVPPGTGTRPTSDRAREGLFSSLQSLLDLEGARVLDLYAGSGALGLEALSRGAASATLVERDPQALAVLRRNVAELGLPAVVVDADVPAYLAGAGGEVVDLVLLDPPYELPVDPVLAALPPLLAPGAVVVAERRTRGPEPAPPPALEALRSRRYGEATLWYFRAP